MSWRAYPASWPNPVGTISPAAIARRRAISPRKARIFYEPPPLSGLNFTIASAGWLSRLGSQARIIQRRITRPPDNNRLGQKLRNCSLRAPVSRWLFHSSFLPLPQGWLAACLRDASLATFVVVHVQPESATNNAPFMTTSAPLACCSRTRKWHQRE